MKATIVHGLRLGDADPANLLYPLIKLDSVTVRVVNVDMPVTARHVHSAPLDAYFAITKSVALTTSSRLPTC